MTIPIFYFQNDIPGLILRLKLKKSKMRYDFSYISFSCDGTCMHAYRFMRIAIAVGQRHRRM
jgi:hypothetical protein